MSQRLAEELTKFGKDYSNTKLIIGFIDMMEEHRDLLIQEWNFRVLLQQHLSQLLD
jgi:hypothetical protein